MSEAENLHEGSGAAPRDESALLSTLLARWQQELRRSPDARPRSDDRGDCEQVLVANLLRASEADTDTNLPALAAAAARYGTLYARRRIDPGALCDELAMLRDMLWELLKAQDPRTHADAVTQILRFDRALSIVVRAAVKAECDPDLIKGIGGGTEDATDPSGNEVDRLRERGEA